MAKQLVAKAVVPSQPQEGIRGYQYRLEEHSERTQPK